MDEQEVYPNAPVVLVALEVRHPVSESLTPSEVRGIKARLSARAPISRNTQMSSVQSIPGAASPTTTNVENFTRFLNRESTLAISFRREAIVVETSVYQGWEEFRAIVSEAIDTRMGVAPVDGMERVGIRYIDEIRVPSDDEGVQWDHWMSPSLLGPESNASIDLPLSQWQGVAVYGSQPGHTLVLRYGPMTGFALDPSSELKRKPADGGDFFLLDIDSFWTPAGSIPEIERDTLIATCNELHAPVRRLFEGLIQNRLRDEVFRSHD